MPTRTSWVVKIIQVVALKEKVDKELMLIIKSSRQLNRDYQEVGYETTLDSKKMIAFNNFNFM